MAGKSLLLFIVLVAASLRSLAQAVPDTSLKQVIPDSARAEQQRVQALPNDAAGVRHESVPGYPNPKKAGLYSAILPGAGQRYNKQYWKIPVVYAGVGAAVYFFQFNSNKYRGYRRAYIASLEGRDHEYTGIYDAATLKQLQDGYKRYLDMTGLLTAVGYTLHVIDAVVFSHLKNFDIYRDITLRMQPVAQPNGIGFGLVAHFK